MLKLIDLFSGAGGLTAGFVMLNKGKFEPVWANDFNKDAVRTYNANFGDHCVLGDVVDIIQNDIGCIPEADIVIGGPPCQGFSLLNKNRTNDPRKELWIPYLQIVEHCKAKYFVMENVPQLLNTEEHKAILKTADALGFKTWSGVLVAADYGVPQIRKRAFIIGTKDEDPSRFFPPPKTHFNPATTRPDMLENGEYARNAAPYRTVRMAIGDLPPPVGTEIGSMTAPLDLHFGRSPTKKSLQRYMAIPDEGMNRFDLQRIAPELTPVCWIKKKQGGTDLFGRLWWDRPSVTIRTEFYKPEKGRYLHPSQHRPITHREAARIQTFPDEFKFLGSKVEIARQIGNAVPPLLGAAVAEWLLRMIG